MEKELTNNRIKILNMKTDYLRMKKLIQKIRGKALQDKTLKRKARQLHHDYGIYEQQALSLAQYQHKQETDFDEEELKLKEIEEEFNITGVNQYKQALEKNIFILNKKVKDLERKLHYAEIEEKRINKQHTEVALFAENEEKDKGMCALRQLEFMKAKIDGINRTLRVNLETRKKTNAQI